MAQAYRKRRLCLRTQHWQHGLQWLKPILCWQHNVHDWCVGELWAFARSIWTLQKFLVKEIPEVSSLEHFRRSLKSQLNPFKAANRAVYMLPKCKSKFKHKDTQSAQSLRVSHCMLHVIGILCPCNIAYETCRGRLTPRDLVYLQHFHSYLLRLIAGDWQQMEDNRSTLPAPQMWNKKWCPETEKKLWKLHSLLSALC